MRKVLALIGPSGCGKTSIAEELRKMDFQVIDSYTTRQMRRKGETGHIFVNRMIFEEHCEIQDEQEYIVALNEFDGHMYWTTIDQFNEGRWNVYVVDVPGLEQLRLNDQLSVTAVYISTDEYKRFTRMLRERGREETLRRMDHDVRAFRIVLCDYTIENNYSLHDAVDKVLEIMDKEGTKDVGIDNDKIKDRR